jgi:hypothetical protein
LATSSGAASITISGKSMSSFQSLLPFFGEEMEVISKQHICWANLKAPGYYN